MSRQGELCRIGRRAMKDLRQSRQQQVEPGCQLRALLHGNQRPGNPGSCRFPGQTESRLIAAVTGTKSHDEHIACGAVIEKWPSNQDQRRPRSDSSPPFEPGRRGLLSPSAAACSAVRAGQWSGAPMQRRCANLRSLTAHSESSRKSRSDSTARGAGQQLSLVGGSAKSRESVQ